MATNSEVKAYLAAIRLKVSEGWCQNAHATDDSGAEVHIDDPRATRVCLTTAIYQTVKPEDLADVYAPIMRVTGIVKDFQLVDWNNNPEQTQCKVLAMLDKAILEAGK